MIAGKALQHIRRDLWEQSNVFVDVEYCCKDSLALALRSTAGILAHEAGISECGECVPVDKLGLCKAAWHTAGRLAKYLHPEGLV